MPFVVAILLLTLAAAGCTTRSKARAEAQAAYLAGQNAALQRMALAQRLNIEVVGPVQHSQIAWTNGLTLARALFEADYIGAGNPRQIILSRQGRNTVINPDDLLHGDDVPLEPGDTIAIQQ
ncbi:MAG: hypothetical protein KGJ60_11405 [Verrucomicrobiota bacterium]|nr:hypothetical protein [Verrucomicrobiota bacterium]